MALIAEAEPFVVIVHGDGEDLLGPRLADHVLVELILDGARRRDVRDDALGHAAAALLLIDDRLAQLDALAADVNVAGPFDERADVAVTFAAKGTKRIPVATGIPGWAARAITRAGVFRRHAISLLGGGRRFAS